MRTITESSIVLSVKFIIKFYIYNKVFFSDIVKQAIKYFLFKHKFI